MYEPKLQPNSMRIKWNKNYKIKWKDKWIFEMLLDRVAQKERNTYDH